MWTYVSSNYDDNIVLYEYTSSRAGKKPKRFYKTFMDIYTLMGILDIIK